jgi:release factor glutamine methyltransferase
MSGSAQTFGSLLALAEEMLGSRFEAAQLFKHVTQKHMQHMSFLREKPVPEHLTALLLKLCRRRMEGEPLQYLLGEWEFWGLPFKVGPGVLIPRADTETLVEVALRAAKKTFAPEILDLCTGTGCVAVSLGHELPEARITALELHEAAYKYLVRNIALNKSRVKPVHADLASYVHPEPLDILVANPPYVPRKVIPTLQPEVRREPKTALDGGKDGLSFFRSILKLYTGQIKPGGFICLEVGVGQSEQVAKILSENNCEDIGIEKDYAGIPRVVSGYTQKKSATVWLDI